MLRRKRIALWRVLVFLVGIILVSAPLAKADDSLADSSKKLATRAEKALQTAQVRCKAEPNNSEAAWQLGRALFDVAEFAEESKQREEYAQTGIEVCRKSIGREPASAAGHYYLAMNLGQLARTKTLGALKLVGEMEIEFQKARDLDENFDHAGPDRNLGLLYLEAPGWPTSIGSRSKARHHLQRAVLLDPKFPENRLNLLEAYLRFADKSSVQREFKAIKEFWPSAKQQFTGEPWEASWVDWEKRWQKIQLKLSDSAKTLESPGSKK